MLIDLLNSMAVLRQSQGDHGQAIQFAERGQVLAREIGSAHGLPRVCATAGRSHHALGHNQLAQQAFSEAIASIETLRTEVAGSELEKGRFFEQQTSPYYEMASLLMEEGDPAEALAYAERAKGRVLLDVLQRGRVDISTAMTADQRDQERRLSGRLAGLNIECHKERLRENPDATRLAGLEAQRQAARIKYEDFQINLYAAQPKLRVRRGQMKSISLEQAGTLIPGANTVLLEYVIAGEKVFLFAITNQPPRRADGNNSEVKPLLTAYTLKIKQSDLANRVALFRNRLANTDVGINRPAHELYELLLGPARSILKNKTNLIIVPDGVLWEMPFQALQPAFNRFLIEDCSVSYAQSLTVLRETINAKRNRLPPAGAASTLLALGNPEIGQTTSKLVASVFMDERLLPLPDAEKQVKILGRLYGRDRSRVYVGADARENRAKAEAASCRILHLATHGILDNTNPMYSHLVLSRSEADENEDGLLEAWEIMKLDLNADIVVLSACDTARGLVANGEGVIGLAWAFFVAGCPTTVVSQWKVESSSTTELMVEFHRNLKPQIDGENQAVSKAQALRRAALKLIRSKQYRHPFYWAPFVLVGDGS